MAKGKRTSIYFDRETKTFIGLTEEIKEQLRLQYSTIDCDHEFDKFAHWLDTSSKGKKRVGDIKGFHNWLKDQYGACKKLPEPYNGITKDVSPLTDESPLRPYINAYLRELWKGREFLLEINKMMP